MSVRPVFVFSLPRSGSTLLQRVLAAHDDVATSPEPWLLLPQLYALRERGISAEYGQVPASRAIREFAARLPGGEADYRAALREFALALYSKASGEAGLFVDKTPRYHLVIREVAELFPEAGLVFLWRNPLAVAASICTTWGEGAWIVDRYRMDLFQGVANLVEGYRALEGRALSVRYEDLVSRPEGAWPSVFEQLGLGFDPAFLSNFGDVRLEARMGDPTGAREYDSLSTEPLEKWRPTLGGPVRKRWCREWLRWIGRERLETMGYDLDELLEALASAPGSPRGVGSDLARSAYGGLSRARRRIGSRGPEPGRRPGLRKH